MTHSQLNSLSPQVICIGEALLDRLGPLGGDPKYDFPVEDCLGGAPANVACGLAKLGTYVGFCGRLGDDSIGSQFKTLMTQRHINLQGLQIDQTLKSRIVLVERDLNGERSFKGFSGSPGSIFADQEFALKDLQEVWPRITKDARFLLIGTIPLAYEISEETLLWAVEKAQEQGIKIALDINWRPTFWDNNFLPDSPPDEKTISRINPVIQKASLIKVCKEESDWFFNSCDPSYISQSLSNAPDIIITDGPNPVKWFIQGFSGETNAISPESVIDTTGAGDAFTAGLLYKYLSFSMHKIVKEQVQDTVKFAAACGAIVCGGSGAIDPQPKTVEVQIFLDSL